MGDQLAALCGSGEFKVFVIGIVVDEDVDNRDECIDDVLETAFEEFSIFLFGGAGKFDNAVVQVEIAGDDAFDVIVDKRAGDVYLVLLADFFPQGGPQLREWVEKQVREIDPLNQHTITFVMGRVNDLVHISHPFS